MTRFLLLLLCLVAPTMAPAQQVVKPVLRVDLEKTAAIPSQPIILRLTLLVPTWMLKPPVFPSFEVPNVIVRLPRGASGPISERIGGATWSGVTRAYRIYPMTAGRFRIPPQTVAVTFAHPETRKPVSILLRTDEVFFQGKIPIGAETLDPFIAAEALTLVQTLEGTPDKLEHGSAFTRTLTARITGTSPIFLPPLIPPHTAIGLAAYPKEPVVSETVERGIISGKRVESVTFVAENGGRHAAPPINLSWYNLRTKRVETTQVTGFNILALGPAIEPTPVVDWRGGASWMIIIVLAVTLAVLLTLWLRPRISAWNRLRREAYFASEAYAFTKAMALLRARKFGDAFPAMEIWSSRLPPVPGEDSPRLLDALGGLGAALYGRNQRPPSNSEWSEVVAALRSARGSRLAAAAHPGSTLPPLNPRKVS